MAPADAPTGQTGPTRRHPWSWVGGFTLLVAVCQLMIYSKVSHLTLYGYDYGQPLAFLPVPLLVGLLAPLVSYRRRDAFLMLVPLYNLFLLWTIGSRLARLPDHDWPRRPDEAAAPPTPPD